MQYKLTEYSHSAGCGCKLSPKQLQDILGNSDNIPSFNKLLVGNETSDDAAVFNLDDKTAIVSTTDFFMPIVDDPFDFGAIAAANAISDIYAMGGTPLMAIAILGWPVDKIPPLIAAQVLKGGRAICHKAGIPLAGGHSIDNPEPIFGLAVTGSVPVNHVKKNEDGKTGDLLYLTKPLGIGTVSTAQKKDLATPEDLKIAINSMLTLNSIGVELGSLPFVHAVTDVTGFGLAGHLLEICDAGELSATINMDQVPVFEFVNKYLKLGCIPGGTHRNWDAFGHRIATKDKNNFLILSDPQTSGGLLISIDSTHKRVFEKFMKTKLLDLKPIGALSQRSNENIIINVV